MPYDTRPPAGYSRSNRVSHASTVAFGWCHYLRPPSRQVNNINVIDLTIEISFVNINEPFRRTLVQTHASYLLISRALQPKGANDNARGLARCVCWPNVDNAGSVRAAETLGFEREGKIVSDETMANTVVRPSLMASS
jgi:RimJ/RimL family protein N-acetyltransferase